MINTAHPEISHSSLELYLDRAKGIAFDTCHKIYVLMDEAQMALMKEYGYEELIYSDEMTPTEMYAKVNDWYESSCSLKFVEAVSTVDSNPNEGFETIVPQGGALHEDEDDWEDEEDDFEDED